MERESVPAEIWFQNRADLGAAQRCQLHVLVGRHIRFMVLPSGMNGIGFENGVSADEGGTFTVGLGDQQAVKGVFMGCWQPIEREHMRGQNW